MPKKPFRGGQKFRPIFSLGMYHETIAGLGDEDYEDYGGFEANFE